MSQPLLCQRDLFQLDDDVVYLNGAYMSPQLKSVEMAGIHGLKRKNTPNRFSTDDFFQPVTDVKKDFAKLLDIEDHERVALIPSVSYGMGTVAHNVKLERHQNVVLPEDIFPSNYYCWKKLCDTSGATLKIIKRPADTKDLTSAWNQLILEAIDSNTAVLAISHVHWGDGTLWDLEAMRHRTRDVGALMILDGTQSTGALPMSIKDLQPDALVSASYKWLMGPYSTGYAYFGEAFDDGEPIEDSWMNRKDSHDFRNLSNYQEAYQPKAAKYCVGEHSNFALLPMMQVALQQLIAWDPHRVQAYCNNLWKPIESDLNDLGILIPTVRAHHLVGLHLPSHFDLDRVAHEFARRNISVSIRRDAIRVSPNVYNTEDDMSVFVAALRATNRMS